MKIFFTIIAFLCLALTINAQEMPLRFGERLLIGSSLTYIFNRSNYDNSLVYHEFTWNKNIAVNLTPSIYAGLSHQSIFSKGSVVELEGEKNRYFITGLFGQYDLVPNRQWRLFGELSWHIGNYCTCGGEASDPYEVEYLQYIGIGAGADFPMWRFLSLDLSFINHRILTDIPLKYNYTQYIIGLNFDLINQ